MDPLFCIFVYFSFIHITNRINDSETEQSNNLKREFRIDVKLPYGSFTSIVFSLTKLINLDKTNNFN